MEETVEPGRPEPSVYQVAKATDRSSIVQVAGDYVVGNLVVSARRIDQDEIDRVRASFAEPAGFVEARLILQRHWLVVLRGKEDIGRRFAALRLLDEVASDGIRELLPDWTSPRASFLPAIDQPTLLDLTSEEEIIPEIFGRQLGDLAKPMYETGGCLVLLVTPQLWRLCAPIAERFTVDLKQPDALEVCKAHLRRLDPSGRRSAWLNEPEMSNFHNELTRSHVSPREAVGLAERLCTYDELSPAAAVDLTRQLQHWKDFLDKNLGVTELQRADRHTVARRRAVLVATAVLDGSPAETILSSSDLLLRKVGIKVPPDEYLVGPELSGLFEELKIRQQAGGVSIVNNMPGVDDAIVSRLWTERPQLHRYLLDWLGELATSGRQPSSTTLSRVAEVLARLAERQRAIGVLDVIQDWLPISAGKIRHGLAVNVLERLAVSGDVGSAVRQRLRGWASSNAVDDGVLIGVAEVCAGRLGRYSADVALNRLQLIAQNRGGSAVREAVVEAIRKIAERDESRRVVIKRIVKWVLKDATEKTRYVGLLGLSALITESGDPVPELRSPAGAVEDPLLREDLRSVWSVLLIGKETRAQAFELAEVWLQQADDGVVDLDFVISVLEPAFRRVISVEDGVGRFLFMAERVSKAREALGCRLLGIANRDRAVA